MQNRRPTDRIFVGLIFLSIIMTFKPMNLFGYLPITYKTKVTVLNSIFF